MPGSCSTALWTMPGGGVALTSSLGGGPVSRWCRGLRDQVATVPDVRSVNLARGIGSTALPSMARSMAASNWMTMSGAGSRPDEGNPVTPESSPHRLPGRVGEFNVLVGVDGCHLLNILDMLSRNSPLGLVVGNEMLLRNSRAHRQADPQGPMAISNRSRPGTRSR